MPTLAAVEGETLSSSKEEIASLSTDVVESKEEDLGKGLIQDDHQVWVWKPAHAGVDLLPIVGRTDDSVTVETEDGEECIMDATDVFPFNSSHLLDCDDAADMNDLHEPALVGLLERRFTKDKIYTYSGDVLISINPQKDIAGLYDIEEETSRKMPHVYGVAQHALDGLGHGENQAILVNGESGAGKTEAAKKLLRYLAAFSTHHDENDSASPASVMTSSNPALEAFGNAVTIRNDNSSRFGKYIKIWFDKERSLRGLSTHQFLLENSRVISHGAGERNYHVFYQLVAAKQQREPQLDDLELGLLSSAGAFRLLQASDSASDSLAQSVDLAKDLAKFRATHDSLLAIGISPGDISAIWRTLAGLLHLGNVVFVPRVNPQPDEDLTAIDASSQQHLSKACELLNLDGTEISRVLLRRYIGGKNSLVTIPLSPAEAANSRDGMIKTIYSRAFAWIVDQTHRTDGVDEQAFSSIGILDIFGFEVLAQNSLEQLCVNFANEELQRLFNWHVFELERSRYASEGIVWDVKACCDNIDLLDALRGAFSLLEEQGHFGARASDDNLIAQFASEGLVHKEKRAATSHFVVHHFASSVSYEITGFLAKNNDALQADLSDFLVAKAGAQSFLARQLFPPPDIEAERAKALAGGGAQRRQARKMASTNSVSKQFRGQMAQLVDELQQTALHFVRCVKANEDKTAGCWDTALVLNQLRHLGVMEAVRIRQEGFPVTLQPQEIAARFGILVSDISEVTPEETARIVLMQTLGASSQGRAWQMGVSGLVFMTKASLTILQRSQHEELRRQETLKREAARLEAEEAARRHQEELAKARAEAEAKAKARAEEEAKAKARAEEEAKANARAEEEAKANARAEEEARAKAHAKVEEARAAEAQRQAAAKLQKEQEEQEAQRLALLREREAADVAAKQMNAAKKLQTWWRMVSHMRQLHKILQARGPWQDVLLPNEAALLSSFVVHSSERDIVRKMGLSKFATFQRLMRSKKRRGLIVTTGPNARILLVDPTKEKLRVVKEVRLDPRSTWVHLRDNKAFVISFSKANEQVLERKRPALVRMLSSSSSSSSSSLSLSPLSSSSSLTPSTPDLSGGRLSEWSFVDILGSSTPWAGAMARPQTVSELMSVSGRPTRLASTEPILWQGALKKQAIRSKRNWRTRWFVLQQDGDEAQLLWYKAQRQTSPHGALLISQSTEICGGKTECSIVIKSPTLPPEGLCLEASSAKAAQRWRSRLEGAQRRSRGEQSI
ncbi:Myosin-12 [Hondaea fermentalgiana]|uniref:Myosin-12 n=1 Tax=Hondaea fermentalgiana TaxID=2315210 RepID=A0A2R5G511_9STRA|nr:Myosin-12 [Hondaea fermentalgiana]|eukprot:GBG26117.1 Myosin-12 [Hondaea fermentalgiana]